MTAKRYLFRLEFKMPVLSKIAKLACIQAVVGVALLEEANAETHQRIVVAFVELHQLEIVPRRVRNAAVLEMEIRQQSQG